METNKTRYAFRILIGAIAASLYSGLVVLGGCGGSGSATGNSSNAPDPPNTSIGTAVVTWEAPNQNMDESCLTDLSGFLIHHGNSVDNLDTTETVELNSASCADSSMSNVCGAIQTCSYTVSGLPSGTSYFVVQAFNASGEQSGYSNSATKVIP